MQTVEYKELLDQWADVCGIESDTVLDLDRARFNNAFNRLIRKAWNWHLWPELLLLEERRYRAIWMAQTYSIDAEVYHEASDAYWRALDDTTAADVPGVSALWEEIEESDLDLYIAYDQDGETGFSRIADCYDKNFRTDRTARRLKWEYDDRGIRILERNSVPETVWVYLYQLCPRFRGDTWSASSTYLAQRVIYYEDANETQDYAGDFWIVLDTTTAGENPLTAPTKFARLEIPEFLADFIVQGARIAFLKGEGQLEKALAEDGNALWDLLAEERNKLLAGGAPPRRARVANI
jgi:hypothetical protein